MRIPGIAQAQHGGRVGAGLGQTFAGLRVGHLAGSIGLFVGHLGDFFGVGARIGDCLVSLLTGRQNRVERADGGIRQARLHIDPRHFNTDTLPRCLQFGQALVDAVDQIATQAFAALGGLIVRSEQFRASDQNGIQVTGSGERHRTARHQSVECRQHVIGLQDEIIGVGDFVEHSHIQLHHTGITGQQITGAGQRIAQRCGKGRDSIGL